MNKKLKRKVIDLKNKIEELRVVIDKQERGSESPVEQKEIIEEPETKDIEKPDTKDIKKARTKGIKKTSTKDIKKADPKDEEVDNDKVIKNPLLEIVNPHDVNEDELTPKLREFALNRIQNG
jgi:hypothetical protein